MALTLVLRFADVGVATYGSLRVVGDPARTVTWVVEEPLMLATLAELDAAVPEARQGESQLDALARALASGPFSAPAAERVLAQRLGAALLADSAWTLLIDCVTSPRAALFVAPSARLAKVPWGLLALADGSRLVELVDVLMALPANVIHARRGSVPWRDRDTRPAVLILDPRVPHQRADSTLGSVLGRPGDDATLAAHFRDLLARQPVRPRVASAVELFRRSDTDRRWLADELAARPSRLLFVGHASAADAGRADQAALHLAEETALTAVDVMALRLQMPPRVALLACASGGDYRFDEATGMVAAVVLGGAELVTATLWLLPTTAGFRRFSGNVDGDPMAAVVIAVDDAHRMRDAGVAVNAWQRAQMRRWRAGDTAASPIYWAALATFTVGGAR